MVRVRFAMLTVVCALAAEVSVGNAHADERGTPAMQAPNGASSAALIGLTPGKTAATTPHRKLWIALGVISAAAVVGAAVAVGVTIGTSSSNNSVFNDWGTLTVTRR
jgi:hypothetical protein